MDKVVSFLRNYIFSVTNWKLWQALLNQSWKFFSEIFTSFQLNDSTKASARFFIFLKFAVINKNFIKYIKFYINHASHLKEQQNKGIKVALFSSHQYLTKREEASTYKN